MWEELGRALLLIDGVFILAMTLNKKEYLFSTTKKNPWTTVPVFHKLSNIGYYMKTTFLSSMPMVVYVLSVRVIIKNVRLVGIKLNSTFVKTLFL